MLTLLLHGGGCTVSVSPMWVSEKVLRNGKPTARSGRKATGLSEMAGLPKLNLFHSDRLSYSCVGDYPIAETKMKRPRELRADNRVATHRGLHDRRSGLGSAISATFLRLASAPRMPSPRPSIVHCIINVPGDHSAFSTLGGVRLSKCRSKGEVSDARQEKHHTCSGNLPAGGLEATV